MAEKQVLILGGYGEAGRCLARYILQRTDAKIMIAGRDKVKAKSFAKELNQAYHGERAQGIALDAFNEEAVKRALTGISLFIQAGPAFPVEYVEKLANAVITAKADWLDVQLDPKQAKTLFSLEEQIKDAGCCFVTQGGFHPGVPAALVRWAASEMDELKVATIASVLNIEGGIKYTSGADELLDLFKNYRPRIWKNGAWKTLKWYDSSGYIKVDFEHGFGRRTCYPMNLDEMECLPEMIPSLQTTGFWIAGYNTLVDIFTSIIMMLGMKFYPQKWFKIYLWSTTAFSRPPYGILLQLDAEGRRKGESAKLRLTLFKKEEYELTAIPMVAAVEQMFDGTSHHPGVHFMAHLVEPKRFLKDIEEMGVEIKMIQSTSNEQGESL